MEDGVDGVDDAGEDVGDACAEGMGDDFGGEDGAAGAEGVDDADDVDGADGDVEGGCIEYVEGGCIEYEDGGGVFIGGFDNCFAALAFPAASAFFAFIRAISKDTFTVELVSTPVATATG